MPIMKICKVCGEEFPISPYQIDTAKYCSKECMRIGRSQRRGEWVTKECPSCHIQFESLKSKNKTYCSEECSRKRLQNHMTYHCDVCGKEMDITKNKYQKILDGEQKSLTCSIECAAKLRETGTDIVCDNCGKVFHRRQNHIDRGSKNKFCSVQCQNEYRTKEAHEYRKCEMCRTEFYCLKTSTQRFCSQRCNSDWQKTLIGTDNPKFKSVLTTCDYCHKEIYVKRYRMAQMNYHFCSTECRQAWFAEEYSQGEDYKEMCRIRGAYLMSLRGDEDDKVNSKPQKIVNAMLDEMSVKYEREKQFVYYSVDNFLPDKNLIIEIQGDYWHCNPIKYTEKISDMQLKNIRKDKAKHTYIKNYYNIEILYLWEKDVVKNPDLCKELILHYINSQGKMDNYHSLNYELIDGKLIQKEDVIVPYQEMDFNIYKQLAV